MLSCLLRTYCYYVYSTSSLFCFSDSAVHTFSNTNACLSRVAGQNEHAIIGFQLPLTPYVPTYEIRYVWTSLKIVKKQSGFIHIICISANNFMFLVGFIQFPNGLSCGRKGERMEIQFRFFEKLKSRFLFLSMSLCRLIRSGGEKFRDRGKRKKMKERKKRKEKKRTRNFGSFFAPLARRIV